MIKYPSIEQFRQVIREVRAQHDFKGVDAEGNAIYQHTNDYPVLSFTGTVKLHGTNAAIVHDIYRDAYYFQSRERELSLLQDNANFLLTMSGKPIWELFEDHKYSEYMAIYGEWCGKGIQKGIALSQLPDKIFVIFGCKIDGEWVPYKDSLPEHGIYNIYDFPTYKVDIDFNNPEAIQNHLIDLTVAVENECPVGKQLGVTGIGEGIVFTCDSDPNLMFKSKGEKHSASKVKVLNAVDTETLESYNEFVEYACTENRLKQGLENVTRDVKNTGDFIKWVANDILKEEQDTIVKNQIEWKKVAGLIANKARVFFHNNL